MKDLGYKVQVLAKGNLKVTWTGDQDAKAATEKKPYVGLITYMNFWKSRFPQLKVSRATEDVCDKCFQFANRRRYLVKHKIDTCSVMDSRIDGELFLEDIEDGNEGKDGKGGDELVEEDSDSGAAPDGADETRKKMLLRAALHVRSARVQRALYQLKMDKSIADAIKNVLHKYRVYTLVVNNCQNMAMPSFARDQPRSAYYVSPLSIFTSGVVDHAHDYGNGRFEAHLHANVYHEGIGKNGANKGDAGAEAGGRGPPGAHPGGGDNRTRTECRQSSRHQHLQANRAVEELPPYCPPRAPLRQIV